MTIIKVVVLDVTGGKAVPVNLPDDIPMRRLIPALVTKMSLPMGTIIGEPMVYVLDHLRTGRRLKDNDTLTSAEVMEDDRLKLVPLPTAGGMGPGWLPGDALVAPRPPAEAPLEDRIIVLPSEPEEVDELVGPDEDVPISITNLPGNAVIPPMPPAPIEPDLLIVVGAPLPDDDPSPEDVARLLRLLQNVSVQAELRRILAPLLDAPIGSDSLIEANATPASSAKNTNAERDAPLRQNGEADGTNPVDGNRDDQAVSMIEDQPVVDSAEDL